MRITIPWGGIALIGGTAVLTMTDWPSIIGWAAVVWGVISLLLQIIVLLVVSATLKVARSMTPEQIKELNDKGMVYKTNHGRTRPVRPTSKQA